MSCAYLDVFQRQNAGIYDVRRLQLTRIHSTFWFKLETPCFKKDRKGIRTGISSVNLKVRVSPVSPECLYNSLHVSNCF